MDGFFEVLRFTSMSDAGERQSRPRSKGLVRRSSRIREQEQSQEVGSAEWGKFGPCIKKEEQIIDERDW